MALPVYNPLRAELFDAILSDENSMTPITLNAYLKKHLRANPDAKHADLKSRLQYAMSAHRKGVRCACGAPIWIIGSAEAGLGCFSCITGDANPDGDYEIAGFD
jgi:hypothetical protein